MGRLPSGDVDLPDDEDDLLLLYNELQRLIDAAAGRDLQAALAAIRYRSRVSAKMEKVAKAKEPTAADMPEDELTAHLVNLFGGMPDRHLRLAVDLYCSRRGFRLVPEE